MGGLSGVRLKRNRIYSSCGVGEVYTYEWQKGGSPRQLPLTDTAVDGQDGSVFSPELDRFFAAIPHLGGTPAQVRVFEVK
jgi:hypothetical protein